MESIAPISITQLNSYIKNVVDRDGFLQNIYIKGEISNFTNHYKSGHFYLTLKDETAVISAVMFKWAASKIKFKPENGMKVIVRGKVSVYERDGKYQVYIDSMQPDGIGDLYTAYNQLKLELEKEGLFDIRYKKAIPKIPMRVGVATSSTGAAVQDIMNITSRRFPAAKIILYPIIVQGEKAPEDIIRAIDFFNENNYVDVIILGRGGGSIEDLWGFNDRNVAYAIFKSKIPIISAVGHETDFTIADFVSDMRAPTPSAAAELAVPSTQELKHKFDNVKKYMTASLNKKLSVYREKYENVAGRRVLTNPMELIDIKKMTLDYQLKSMIHSMESNVAKSKEKFVRIASKIETLNPMATILRGYCAVKFGEKIVTSVEQIKKDDEINLTLSDGNAKCKVISKRKSRKGV